MIAIASLRKNSVCLALVAAFGLACAPAPAFALDEIYSPHAEPHEFSLEYNGSRTFDGSAAKNDAQEHELALEYGVNDWLTVESSAGFEKDPGDHVRLADAELESRIQFSEPGENWLDSGFLFAYDFSTQNETPDSLEAKLLLQKDFGKITALINTGFETDVGRYSASGGPDYVFLGNVRYRLSQYFQPGLEVQSDLGQSHTFGHFDQQEHYIGPAIYGQLFGRLKYQVGWFAGVTDASAASAARLLLEYETHF